MEYRVPTNEKPTFINKEAALGALIGLLIPFPIVGSIVGAAIGASAGKTRMEREFNEGKIVKEPTAWNMKAAIGALAGHAAGVFAATGIALIAGISLCTPVGLAIAGACVLTGTIIGGLKGGEYGKNEMKREYADAEAYYSTTGGQGMSPQMQVEYCAGKSYAAQLAAERQQACSRVNSI